MVTIITVILLLANGSIVTLRASGPLPVAVERPGMVASVSSLTTCRDAAEKLVEYLTPYPAPVVRASFHCEGLI